MSPIPGAGFGHDFRVALGVRRTSLRALSLALAERDLRVSTPLLAAWRSGTLTPAGAADLVVARALEEALDLTTDHLARWVDPDGTPQRPRGRARSSRDTRAADAVQRARTALGFERTGQLVQRRVDLVVETDEHGVERRVTQRTEWVAQVDDVDSFPAVLVIAGPVLDRAVVEPLSGCRLGPSYADLAEGVFATALMFAQPLRVGESVTTVHRTHLPEDLAADTAHEHRLLDRVEQISLGVVLDAAREPRTWQGFSRTDDEEWAVDVVPQDGVARVSRDDFGPGVVGLRWSW